ncbi:MAG: ABC transporter ATP-binding protein/permease [Lachnospiraceae bacterium]|nr:ABC transporter ATP-binding protein/permease [Lachnospiraceae bacterium]
MKKNVNLKLLFNAMGPYKITLILSVIFSAISAVVNIYAFTFVYKAANEIITNINDIGNVDATLLRLYGKDIMFNICGAFGLYGMSLLFSHITAFNTAARLKNKLIKHIGTLPNGFFDTNSSGALRKLIEKNTDLPETLIAHQIPNTTQSIVLPIVFAIFMFKYNAIMAVACLIPVIIGFALLMMIMAGNGGDFVKKYQKASADISNAAVEYVRGIPVMKIFSQTADSFKRYSDSSQSFIEYTKQFAMSMITADSAYNTAINAIFFTLIPTAIILGKKSGAPIVASFVFFASLIPMAVTMLKRIMSNSSETIIVSEAMERLEELLSEKPMEYKDNKVPSSYGITFDNVSFKYTEDGPMVIDNINMILPMGSVTAFVGMSGGGKSTLAALAARFRDCTEGRVLIGDVDIKDISQKTLNDLISVVFQESTLLKSTLRENVSLYKKDATDEEILRALSLAQCDDILDRLPNGIDTVYGAEGTYFSGGEVQRIAIARAILKDSPIIILDEATAFADSENEYLIRKAFKELLKGKTVIMIAHRMSTVSDADQIFVIENGQIQESGNHNSLMELHGKYKTMVDEYNSAINWKIGEVV